MTIEKTVYEEFNKKLQKRGWLLQQISYIDKDPNENVAVRNFLLTDGSMLDYVLFVKGKACGVIWMRDADECIQNLYGYNRHLPPYIQLWFFPLPFVYQVRGKEIFFNNALVVSDGPKQIAAFPTPQQVLELLTDTQSEKKKPCRSERKRDIPKDCHYAYLYVPQNYTKHMLEKLILKQGFKKYYPDCYLYMNENDCGYRVGIFLFIDVLIMDKYQFEVTIRSSLNAGNQDILFQNQTLKLLSEAFKVPFYTSLGENEYFPLKKRKATFLRNIFLKIYEQNKMALNCLNTYVDMQENDRDMDFIIRSGVPLPSTFANHLALHYLHTICENYFNQLYRLLTPVEQLIDTIRFRDVNHLEDCFRKLHEKLDILKYVKEDPECSGLSAKLNMILQAYELPVSTLQFNFHYTLFKLKKDIQAFETIVSKVNRYVGEIL